LEGPERSSKSSEGNRKSSKRGDNDKDIGKVTGKVIWDSKQGWSEKGESHPSNRNQDTLDGKDDGTSKKEAPIAATIHIIFAISDKPADSRGDAEVEQY
jgi:hypothetical protein